MRLRDKLKAYAKKVKRMSGIGRSGVHPSVYVGTYKKYNDGSLYGEWVDLTKFKTYEEFMRYLHKLHADERDPEFMVQDYEGYPEHMYYESGISKDTFYQIKDWYEMFDGDEAKQEAYDIISNWADEPITIDEFDSRYLGTYDSKDDYIEQMIEDGVLDPKSMIEEWGTWVLDTDAIWRYLDTSGNVQGEYGDHGLVVWYPSI